MGYYKIKNITHKLAKRDVRKDSVLKIDYKEGFMNKTYNLNAGEEIAISCTTIPSNIHLLRMKQLVTVVEISENLFHMTKRNTVSIAKNVIPSNNRETIIAKNEEVEIKTTRKSSTRKKATTKETTNTSKSTESIEK